MYISVVDPIGRAFERTKLMLFKPFDIGKWFVMGFALWLAQLGQGGGFNCSFPSGSSSSSRGPGPGAGPEPSFREVMDKVLTWIHAYLAWIIIIGAIVLCVIFTIYMVLLWLNSRRCPNLK